MATTLTNTTFSTTYKDDFKDSDGYHRILFNSGKALQARELTQIQTFLQQQITRFGNNIFKEGAIVKPGGVNLNQGYEFVKLNTTVNALPTDASTIFPGAIFEGATSGIRVKVLQVVEATASDPATLYIQYIKTSSGTSGTSPVRLTPGENIDGEGTASGKTVTVQSVNTTDDPAVGVGILATIKSGVYYARGHFVFTEDQSKIISKYSDTTGEISLGFESVEDVVTTTDDQQLFDNQGAVPDVSAPGADRYRIRLTIAIESEVDSDKNFIPVAIVKEGLIYSSQTPNDAYNIPAKVIAERIKENSGDYTVKPFKMSVFPDSENTHLLLKVSDGVVVVDGFRAAREFPTTIRLEKPVSTRTIENEVTPAAFGNFLVVNPSVTASPTGASSTMGIPTLLSELELRDSSSMHGGAADRKIGTARLKAVTKDGTKLRYHVFDVKMNSGKAFRNVKSIGADSNTYFNPELENGKCVLKAVSGNTSIFPLPKPRPQTITDIQVAVQRQFSVTANGAGELVIPNLTVSGETFTNTSDWIVGDSAMIMDGLSFSNAGGTQSMTVSGAPAGQVTKVLAYVNKSAGAVRSKILKTTQSEYAIESDGGNTPTGNKFLNLRKPDLYKIEKIQLAADSTSDLRDRFTVDYAQFPSHYGLAKLDLKQGAAAPGSNVLVRFQHFEHANDGDFFAANSYSGQVEYKNIPSIRMPTGSVLHLRNSLDFRAVMDSNGAFLNTSTSSARPTEVPQPNSLVNADVTYFLGVAGKLVVDTTGVIKFVQGSAEFNPQVPQTPDQSLSLYDVVLGANTLNSRDVRVKKIDHRRFTMKDISQLEKRVDQLENLTSLTLLEHDTKNMQILDSAGNDRAKTGFIIDNFTDHSLTDALVRVGHRASLDPTMHRVRPMFSEDNIKLMYDSSASSNVQKYGDNIYLKFDEVLYLNQDLATKAIAINPFGVAVYEGVLTVSPGSDEWRDIERINDKIVPGTTKISGVNGYNWDNWTWNWNGQSVEDLGIGSNTNEISGMVNRVVASESVMEVIEDRLIQSVLLPYIRARKVFFKAEGLRPLTKHFMFFDGQSLANYVKEEGTFTKHSDNPVDYGNTLFGKTVHPDGAQELETDAKGEIIGSVLIPNNDDLKFKVGTREMMLLDITAPNPDNATSSAKHNYVAQGHLDTKTGTLMSSRILHVAGFKVTRQVVNGDHGGDGNGHTVVKTTYDMQGSFFYSNEKASFSDDPASTNTGKTQVDDFSVSFHVDPDIGAGLTPDELSFGPGTSPGNVSISNVSTTEYGAIPGTTAPTSPSHQFTDYNTNEPSEQPDTSGYSSSDGSGAGQNEGGWT